MPTWYRGVLYRSRLEARWGAFFHELGIPAEWEPQGYRCADGTPYLPDFALFPALGTLWAEIKPTWQADPDGIARWRKFSAIRPQPSRSALIVGPPAVHLMPLVIGGDLDAAKPVQGPWEDDTQEWRPCPSGHHFDLAFPGMFGAKFAEDGCPDHFGGDGEERIAAAVSAALSERFDPRRHKRGAAA